MDVILSKFPTIELFYGNILHRKVHSDYYQIIPKGIKCIVWYTYFETYNVCYLLYLDNQCKKISRVEKTISCFSNALCHGKGTILSGVLFHKKNTTLFATTDIHYYKGQELKHVNYNDKIRFIAHLLSSETKQKCFSQHQVVIASVIITNTYEEAIQKSKQLEYEVYCITFVSCSDNKVKGFLKYKVDKIQNECQAIFNVQPQVRCDMYNIYINQETEVYGIASIPDYKTSVFMNTIFRNIKENKNLDLLEESDDECEFEDRNENKHVDIGKIVPMMCVYLPRFKKWKPIQICDPKLTFTDKQTILEIEKKSHYSIYGNVSKSKTSHRCV
jgi:hypothetical protein